MSSSQRHTMLPYVSTSGTQRPASSCRPSCRGKLLRAHVIAQAQPSSPPPPTVPHPVAPKQPSVLPESPILLFGNQRVHSTSRRGMEVIQGMSGWASKELGRYLKPSDRCWQPSDFLPDPASDTFIDQVSWHVDLDRVRVCMKWYQHLSKFLWD